MIAICASCHDEVHRGSLSISDDDLRRWKRIIREQTSHDVLTIEPGENPMLLLGSVAFTGESGVVVFDLSEDNRLEFTLRDGDLYFLNITVSDRNGGDLIKIVENQVKYSNEPLSYERRQGKFIASVPISEEFLPSWALTQMRRLDPCFAIDGRLRMLAAEVVEPGIVRIEGIWRAQHGGFIVVTRQFLSFLRIGSYLPLALCGEGRKSVIRFAGPITAAALRFE